MRKKDFLWFLLYPVYQTIGTMRHEGSHALAAMAEGAEVTKFVFWPSFYQGRFQWGYVRWVGSTTWFTIAAPYCCDLLTFFIAILIILEAKPKPRWLWFNILIIGMLSSFVNSVYNYFGGVAGSYNDVGRLSLSRYCSTPGDYTTAIFARKRGIQNRMYTLPGG